MNRPIDDSKVQKDLLLFADHLYHSTDIDPLYPFLKELYLRLHDYFPVWDEERSLWFTIIYVAYYNVASAFFAERVGWNDVRASLQPIAVERRGLRGGGKLLKHLHSWSEILSMQFDIKGYLEGGFTSDPEYNYEVLWQRIQEPWGNGRWAAFKMLDILRHTHDFNIAAPDMRMEFCSGPKEGLIYLYELPKTAKVPALNSSGNKLRALLAAQGLNLDYEELETVLCNYHAMTQGRYYVGHDIDELEEVINKSGLEDEDKGFLMDIRKAVIPNHYLGEMNNWYGLQKQWKHLYQQTGTVFWRKPLGILHANEGG